MQPGFNPTPHAEAIAAIKGKPAVTRKVFDQLLPELRGRAFTVTGIEGANALQRIRDTIAALPAGETWENVKKDLIAELDPYLGDGAEQRATLLLRTHAFQAFQSANYQVAQADEDTTHIQYLATEDGNARDSHIALNGLILPKDDPFWDTHMPPWDWGCRCRIRAMNPDLVDEARVEDEQRAPENRLIPSPAVADQLRNGTLMRDGQRFDVTPPSQSGRDNAYSWDPRDLRIPLDELKKRYAPEVFATFENFSRAQELNGGSLWDWLDGKTTKLAAKPKKADKISSAQSTAPARLPDNFANWENAAAGLKVENSVAWDENGNEIPQLRKKGTARSIGFTSREIGLMENSVLAHNHPGGSSFSTADIRLFSSAKMKELIAVGATNDYTYHLRMEPGKSHPNSHALSRAIDEVNKQTAEKIKRLEKIGQVVDVDVQISLIHDRAVEISKRFGMIYERRKRTA